MRRLLLFIFGSLLVISLVGCAGRQVAKNTSISTSNISVRGFVKTSASYCYREGMTIGDALQAAGGYGKCRSCQEFFDTHGWHPTFDQPPILRRNGRRLQLPQRKTDWLNFTVQPQDEIRFRHFLF
jgi:hypothetical protein